MTPKESYLKAGKIHQDICEKIKPKVKVGATFLELAKEVEQMVQEANASLAFPVNIQPNNEVHYSPLPNDTRFINEGDIVKVDIGIHIDGYIADGAFTVSFNKDYDDMVTFTDSILTKTLTGLKPGMKVSEIGKRLDEHMKGSKYKIIRNLMGHQLKQWDLHSTKSVPVYEDKNNPNTMEPGDAFAIEIFITDGNGLIKSSPKSFIYSVKQPLKAVRDPKVRKLCQEILEKRKSFPFTERYVVEHLGYSKIDFFNLKRSGNIHSYPLLLEKKGSKVAQSEHVIFIDEKEIILTTKQKA